MRRLGYTLTRRQCWQVHADVWLEHWKVIRPLQRHPQRAEDRGNLWCLLFDRHNLEIPVELVDDDIIRRMRCRMMP